MNILWLQRGINSLHAHIRHIAEENPQAADKMAEIIEKSVRMLADFPHTGRPGRIAQTRELVVTPYVIAYRVKRDRIEILHIALNE